MKMNSIAKMFLTLSVAALPLMFAVSCEKETTTPTNDSTSDPVVPVNPPDDPGNDPDPDVITSHIPTAFPTKHISRVVRQGLNWQTMEPEKEYVTDFTWEGDNLKEIVITSITPYGDEIDTSIWGYRFYYADGKIASMVRLHKDSNGDFQEGQSTTYEYNADGLLTRHVGPQTGTYSYPSANRVNINVSMYGESANFTLNWAGDNVSSMSQSGYSVSYAYTNHPSPFYFPIHFDGNADGRDDFTAGIAMPSWSKNCASRPAENNRCEWQWTFGDDGYPTELFETNNDDWKGSPIRNRYTFTYAN